jgi:aspartate racemase
VKHLGILAHSAEGAALCFLAFCQEGFRRIGPHDHPDVTLDCIAMARSMLAWDEGDYVAIRSTFARSAERLARAGADFFVCPDNTAHIALEQPGPDLALPGLHIAQVVAQQAARDGRRRVGVLGTRYTMDGQVYPAALAACGIAAELPEPDDRALINTIIFDELVNGVFTDASRAEYVRVIAHLADRGCDAVALVCTEIPLLVTPEVSPLPTLDSTRLLARAAFGVALGEQAMPAWRGGPARELPDRLIAVRQQRDLPVVPVRHHRPGRILAPDDTEGAAAGSRGGRYAQAIGMPSALGEPETHSRVPHQRHGQVAPRIIREAGIPRTHQPARAQRDLHGAGLLRPDPLGRLSDHTVDQLITPAARSSVSPCA